MNLTSNTALLAVTTVACGTATVLVAFGAMLGPRIYRPARMSSAGVMAFYFVLYTADLFGWISNATAADWRRGAGPILWGALGWGASTWTHLWQRERRALRDFQDEIHRDEQ